MRALLALVLVAAPAAVPAQVVDLRIEAGERSTRVPGVARDGSAYYPIWALDRFGAETVADARGSRTVLFGDTLVFDVLSPWFRDGRRVHHLAFPAIRHAGILHLPEQFFIEWLPANRSDRVEYRNGNLRARGGVAAPVASRAGGAAEKRVVILDPGHGGRDPGLIGPNGLREKEVTLRIAEAVAGLLRERDYEVHLTRATDTLIALGDRPRLANRLRAGRPAIFLSIHANGAPSRGVRGFETFFLSEARTEDERRVAEMENAAVEFEDGPSAPVSETDLILNGLRNDFWVRASNDLAEAMQLDLANAHDGPDRGVKRAGFRVLVGALMPAALVEVAFLSNPVEANLLSKETFRADIANGIADAVVRFFDSHRYLSTGAR